MKIFIDAGHNYSGFGTGAVGNGLKEQDITFQIADKLKKLIVSSGHQVKMSRNKLKDNIGTTVSLGLQKRAEMANEWGADLFISIHCNAFNTKARGTETLVFSLNGKAAEYGKKINDAIVKKLGTKDRGIKERKELAVLRRTVMPAVLVETAFIDNADDARLLVERQDDFASAIAEGVIGLSNDLSNIEYLVNEYVKRGIVADKNGMVKEMKENPDGRLYWLARKTLEYIRGIEK